MFVDCALSLISIFFFLCSIFKIPKTSKESNTVPMAPPKFKKLTYVLIDGLRYDGFVPVSKTGLYFNNFSFTKDLEKLKTTFLSVAGIPTATTCRVISMMTGTPSNQIEELMAFFTSNLTIESLPDKFLDRKMAFYGDETWEKTFKCLKGKCCCVPAFDKCSVEEDEIKLISRIKDDKTSEIKFIHLLSGDAFGHVYGIDHDTLRRSQLRANDLIEHLYSTMDDDCLLVVTSDHGVTDEGAHGGNSKQEMASVCGFYSKNKTVFKDLADNLISRSNLMSYYENMPNFNVFEDANTPDDFIKTENLYRIIHQDDILPTVSYFLGVPTPMNTYGNLIPYIVSDTSAQLILSDKKKINLKRSNPKFNFNREFLTPEQENYFLTALIYFLSCSKRPFYFILSISIGLYTMIKSVIKASRIAKSNLSKYNFLELFENYKEIGIYAFATIMVSHSYRAFANEDLIWILSFLITNFSVANLIFMIYFLKTPGKKFFSLDKQKFEEFSGLLEISLLLIAFLIAKSIEISRDLNSSKSLISVNKFANFNRKKLNQTLNNILQVLPQLTFILYSCLFSASYDDKIFFGSVYPSFDSLMTIHFEPLLALNFIFFLRNLDVKRNQATKYILLSVVPYLLNFEKVNQSINYNVFNSYSDQFGSLSNVTGVLSYFIIPRLYIHLNLNLKASYLGLALNSFTLLTCFICSWVMHSSLVFQYFFVGRLLFTVMFCALDVIVESILLFMKSRSVIWFARIC